MFGFPDSSNPNDNLNSNTLFISEGTITAGNVLASQSNAGGFVTFQTANGVAQLYRGDPGFGSIGGFSGAAVTLNPGGSLAGVGLPNELILGILTNGSLPDVTGVDTGALFEPISDIYADLATAIFGNGSAANPFTNVDPGNFANNVLIADRDGFIDAGGGVQFLNNTVNGTGFDEDIFIESSVGITVNGNGVMADGTPNFAGGGTDRVIYTNVDQSAIGTNSINVNIGQTVNVQRTLNNGVVLNDTLNNIDAVFGTANSDTFNITSLVNAITINGNPNVPPFPSSQNAPSQDGSDLKDSGPLFMQGGNDTITISQDLLDAGAAITYMSEDNSGVVWIEQNGVFQKITYTGIANEPLQAPEDFFWGTSGLGDAGGLVNIDASGGVAVDLSNSTMAVDSTVLGNIPLFGLSDSFVGTNLG